MSTRYLLDTNIVSHIIKARDAVLMQRVSAVPVNSLAISSVTLAEMEYGWHRGGQALGLQRRIEAVLLRVDVVPWDEAVARHYGELRSAWEAKGISLAAHDMMIAAHAVAVGATLVSRDKAFGQVPDRLVLEVW
jgi:tRNA(fMet)-specific endonuclease VapC